MSNVGHKILTQTLRLKFKKHSKNTEKLGNNSVKAKIIFIL